MDVEYEDCSIELIVLDIDFYIDNVNVRSFFGDKVVKQFFEEKLQVVGKLKNFIELIVVDFLGKGQIDYVCMFVLVLCGIVLFFIL